MIVPAYSHTCILTDAELQAALAFWQEALQLRDWSIRVGKRTVAEGMSDTAGGYFWSNNTHRAAEIWIRHEDDLPACDDPEKEPENRCCLAVDHERTLVHELLHLHVTCWDVSRADSTEDLLMEQMLNSVSRCLVWLKRQIPAAPPAQLAPLGIALQAPVRLRSDPPYRFPLGDILHLPGAGPVEPVGCPQGVAA